MNGVIIIFAFMADTHLGTKLNNTDQLKSLDMFLGLIKQHKEECHCIFVCGDLFDHRLTIEEARFASLFLINLVCNNCGRNGRTHVPVHFIHGTYTHDYEQYGIYLPILNKIDNTEVFYTKEPCVGKLNNGSSVLYLPQTYGDDIDYNSFLNDNTKYDIIIGHGPISSLTKSPCKSTNQEIVHSTDLLGRVSKICVFGHYHGYTDFGNNVYYAGPWLTWRYNEEEQRKFFLCNDNFEVETQLNPFAMVFKTIEIENPEQLREIISTDITTPHRFVIKPENVDLETYHSIMSINKKNTNISFKMIQSVDDNIETKPLIQTNHVDNGVGPIESLITYIKDKYDIDTTDEIMEYNDKITKVI